ncbi:Lysophospholipase, alpha-beta hydrolase superfamily [Geodermatophilus africanus]|uniref:Lysophospholipase, alpha-beta hydrolase superfamily n=1 Tax=Geodermatophilus africanus TaxID=1137993 RepID=A0A1H3EZU6_9ACTN|nr:alpha/beta fold hydrolase [Geodermatophilus africanus]SDX83568.1 Lysophospholipase, alpha-beta hydrolase superfamily [Geodermatophilus africanus]
MTGTRPEGSAVLAELVAVPAPGTPLDGLFYEPGRRPLRAAAMLMHGNGMNFYYGASGFLPPHLAGIGLAVLSFNRHGHDTVSARTRTAEGNAYQTVAEAIDDNERAARWLAGRGHPAPVVIGHSNGGMLASEHVARHPETPALVLLSAHLGGTQMLARASALGLLAGDRLDELTDRAAALVAAGRPDELLLMPGWYYVTTAGSFLDMARNLPSLLDNAPRITCPVLYVRGEREDVELYPAERFAELAGGRVDVVVIRDCDHFYTGYEAEVGGRVAAWLDSVLA